MSLNWNALGLGAPSIQTRVVVAMSGGVDSSVTACLLQEAGYDVVGITLQLYDHGMIGPKKGACCAGQDIYDATQVAQKMGFPHYVLDYESRFRNAVIDDFADGYLRGETPIPCVQCNQQVKFKDLLEAARGLGASAMVTGHYVQRIQGVDGPELHQAVDPLKDQSYFLFGTTRDELAFLSFPLGGLHKHETRQHALRFGLDVADKPDSQDICFVPNGNYAAVVQKLRPEAAAPGDIVDLDGTILGRHQGIIHYTIGQRKGLGIGGRTQDTAPLFVVRLDPALRQVIVGPREALKVHTLSLNQVNWISGVPREPVPITVKIRSSQKPLAATVTATGHQTAQVQLTEGEYGVAAGQACVFYDGSRILGGGWIQTHQRP